MERRQPRNKLQQIITAKGQSHYCSSGSENYFVTLFTVRAGARTFRHTCYCSNAVRTLRYLPLLFSVSENYHVSAKTHGL